MSATAARPLEAALTERIAALDGVKGIFPDRSAGAVLGQVLGTAASGGLIRVDRSGPVIRISARLATARSVPARSIVAGAVAVIEDLLEGRPYALELEFSTID